MFVLLFTEPRQLLHNTADRAETVFGHLKLAEENAKASLLRKTLNLSALNCCKWSVVS